MTSKQKRQAKFVYIPAHVSDPLEEWQVEYDDDTAVECLLDRVKAHFAKQKKPKTAEQLAAQRESLLQHVPADQRESASLSPMLAAAADMSMVENVALLSNAKDNDFIGVNLYCDDEAGVYGAPTNVRASEIAKCAGKHLNVRGDAFLARVRDDGGDIFERLDLGLCDVSSSAKWVLEAERQNRKKAEGESAESAMRRLGVTSSSNNGASNTSAVIIELSASASAREEGNAAFRRGKWKDAEAAYTRAIELAKGKRSSSGGVGRGGGGGGGGGGGVETTAGSNCNSNSNAAADDEDVLSASNNRAAARIKLGDFQGAAADASRVISSRPTDVKARLRRASARESLGDCVGASEDYRAALKVEPKNAQALGGLEKVKGKGKVK